ncbi:hypothetical protein LOAG_04892 [Loa loa]|uniref:Uncharacterized protein n=1 Tax=Loa loa TaxID=7209 RepID=A0A1S0U122_LOALO|nr:hypothetical protein LOAG_04892 [Loa loa]EFO23591.1 hypothetical protein LOAG_04892 [Loa loa]
MVSDFLQASAGQLKQQWTDWTRWVHRAREGRGKEGERGGGGAQIALNDNTFLLLSHWVRQRADVLLIMRLFSCLPVAFPSTLYCSPRSHQLLISAVLGYKQQPLVPPVQESHQLE